MQLVFVKLVVSLNKAFSLCYIGFIASTETVYSSCYRCLGINYLSDNRRSGKILDDVYVSDLLFYFQSSGAFVFGAMSFTDKLSNGVAVMLLQQFSPCGRYVLSYSFTYF